jgi:DNA-binding NarL/FixJ family response regulator
MTGDEQPAGASVGLSGFEPLVADVLALSLATRGIAAAAIDEDGGRDAAPEVIVAAVDVNRTEDPERLRTAFAEVPLVVVATSMTAPVRRMARRVDAAAVLTRQDDLERLAEVLEVALGGGTVVLPDDGDDDRLVDLTAREIDVLRMVASGSTNTQIGTALGISPHTARTHVQHVMAKLGVRTRLGAGAVARDAGLTSGTGP